MLADSLPVKIFLPAPLPGWRQHYVIGSLIFPVVGGEPDLEIIPLTLVTITWPAKFQRAETHLDILQRWTNLIFSSDGLGADSARPLYYVVRHYCGVKG